MRTLILTGYNEQYEPIGKLTSDRMRKYAKRHGFDFESAVFINDGFPPSWQKLKFAIRGLQNYDRVIWMDADVFITNLDYVPQFIGGLHFSRDWGSDANDYSKFSCGVFVAFPDASWILEWAWQNRESFRNATFWEQDALRSLYPNNQIFVHHRRDMNAVPAEISPDVQEPWKPYDWLCHLTMITVPEKIKLLHEIADRLPD